MNDKQKEILKALIQLEAALNGLIRDAEQEGLPVDLMTWGNKVHVSINQTQFRLNQVMTVSNDE